MTESAPLTVLVVGSGGREHALVQMCRQSPAAGRVIAAPGNGGMAAEVDCYDVGVEDIAGLVDLARRESAGLVVVGPEVPLGLGLVDALEEAGIAAYGPRRDGARLETSKAFCKDFLGRHGIPTAAYGVFTETGPALAYLDDHPAPIVVKASGLAAGKGVILAMTRDEAETAVRDMLEGGTFGASGREVVIEEMLFGEEASIHVICSGEDFVALPASQDHKRAGEGDTGPNTGGMGAYTPTGAVTPKVREQVEALVIRPTLTGLKADGIDFRGTLYAGLMLTASGPKVLEYNVRFGDPETQVVLPMLTGDLLPVLLAAARGDALPGRLEVHPGAAMVVVLAAAGYPGAYFKGERIDLPSEADLPNGTAIVHAGTVRTPDGSILTNGGRVLGVSARATSLREAAAKAYAVCDRIEFDGKYLRRDIGHRELNRNPQ